MASTSCPSSLGLVPRHFTKLRRASRVNTSPQLRTVARVSLDSATELASSSRLSSLLGNSLGATTNASDATRRAIETEVLQLERQPGPTNPITSNLLDGEWRLRYTTSPGTVSAIGGWETIAGAVTDVRQVCLRRNQSCGDNASSGSTESSSVAVTNIVTVDVAAVQSAVEITQEFEAKTVSTRRWSTELQTSNIDVRRLSKNISGSEKKPSFASFLVTALDPLGVIKQLAQNVMDESTDSYFKINQPVEDTARPSPKTQQVTHLSESWRVVRETNGNSLSIYSRT